MYAQVTTFRVEPGKLDEFAGRVRETLAPAVAQQPGHRGGLLLSDRATGKVLAVSLWETEADLQASESESGYYQEQLGKYEPFFTVPPVRESYEVVLRE